MGLRDEEQKQGLVESFEAQVSHLKEELEALLSRAARLCGGRCAVLRLFSSQEKAVKVSFGFGGQDPGDPEADKEGPLTEVPLQSSEGLTVGTLGVGKFKEGTWGSEQMEILRWAAENVVSLFESRVLSLEAQKIQQQFSDVQKIVQAGGWELDVPTGKTLWSEQIYHIYQIPVGTPTHKLDGLSFYAPRERPKLAQLIQDCIHKRQPFDDIFEFCDAKGVKKWVRSIGRPVEDSQGQVVKLIGTFQDVTEQKRYEESLRESENRYRQIFSQSKDAMMTLEPPNWHFSSCNTAALELFKVASETEFVELGPWSFSPSHQPDGLPSAEKAQRMIGIAMSSGTHFFEWTHSTKEGQEIPCTIRLSRIDEGGRSYLQAVVRDISERKLLEKKILDIKEVLNLAIEGGNLGIWDWNLADNSVTYNESWAQLRGLEILDLNMDLSDWESRVHPEDLPRAHEAIQNYLSGKTDSYECLHRVRHKEGRWVHIMGRGRFCEWDQDGKPLRFTGTDTDLTELVASREKLDLFFARAPFGFAFCDMQGRFIECNREFERLTGYSIEELSQLAYWDLTPESYAKQEALQLQHLESKGEYGPYRKEYRTKSGQLVPVELSGFVVEDYSGQKGIWSIVEDITEEKRAEEERRALLLEQEALSQKLNAIFRFSPAVVYECQVNRSWTMNFVSSHIEALSGYPAEDFVQNRKISFGDIIHPEDADYVERGVLEALREQRGYDLTYRILHKKGSVRWVWERGAQAPASEDLIGVLFDVTEKKRQEAVESLISDTRAQFIAAAGNKGQFYSNLIERAVRSYEAEFGLIVEVDGAGVFTDFVLVDSSLGPGARTMSFQQMFGAPDYREMKPLLQQSLETHQEVTLRESYGFQELRVVPILYNRKLVALVALGQRKSYFSEEEMNNFNPFYVRLGEMINEMNLARDLETQKKISFHQSKLASIGELATGVAHEINNPLAIIQGQMETLNRHLSKSGLEDEVILQKTSKTLKSVERIAHIVKGLRTFARADTIETKRLDLRPLLLETLEMVGEIYQKEGIDLRVELDEELWVQGNSGRLQQVFVNLLNNARDAVLKTQRKLIFLQASAQGPGRVEISVADTGPGIPPELREKVFDPFFTTKEEGVGTGVGLALVNSIVREHEGSVDLDLTYREGARMVVSLKRAAP